jgi:hypothetical protein
MLISVKVAQPTDMADDMDALFDFDAAAAENDKGAAMGAEEDEVNQDEDDRDDASDSSESSEVPTTIQWDPAIATIEDAERQLRGDDTRHLTVMVDDDDFEEVEREA